MILWAKSKAQECRLFPWNKWLQHMETGLGTVSNLSDYSHLHVLADAVMTQYSVKQGLAKFGAKGAEAVAIELKEVRLKLCGTGT
jgi:hypothetical protein